MSALARLFAPVFCVLAASSAFAAGDVTAGLTLKGELQLVGDDLANELQIDRDPDTKEFILLGRNGTTINGVESIRLLGVRAIRATMNGGDDVLAMGGFGLKRYLYVDLGDGNDTLSLYTVRMAGRLTVYGGLGDDTVTVAARCDLLGGAAIQANDGANHVDFSDSYSRARTRIFTGEGDDLVEIHRCGFTSTASLSIKTGSGQDVVDYVGNTFQCPVGSQTGDGVDTINVRTSRFVKSVGMNAGDGDDEVTVERCTFDARFFISGGAGTNKAAVIGVIYSSSGLLLAGGKGHSGNFYWSFIIVNVF